MALTTPQLSQVYSYSAPSQALPTSGIRIVDAEIKGPVATLMDGVTNVVVQNMQKKLSANSSAFAAGVKTFNLPAIKNVLPDVGKYPQIMPGTCDPFAASSLKAVEKTYSCDEVVEYVRRKIEELKKKLAAAVAPIDGPLQKLRSKIEPIMKLIQQALNFMKPPTSIQAVLSWVQVAINFVLGIFLMTINPIIEGVADPLYEQYQRAVNTIAGAILPLDISQLDCAKHCKYHFDPAICPTCIRMNASECFVNQAIMPVIAMKDQLVGTLDLPLMPVNTILQQVQTIIDSVNSITQKVGLTIIPRQYPPQSIVQVLDIKKAQSGANIGMSANTAIFPTQSFVVPT